MARLGEILIEKGAVSADGLRSALEACRRNGGRLGTWLVRLGLINEATLLQALSEQTGCPSASTLELATAPTDARALIPAALAKRHLVVAFNRQGRNLDVAMANPNDLLLVDELASVTRLVVRPHVATEAALSAVLAIAPVATAEAAPAAGPARAPVREWRQFWRLESGSVDLFRALEAESLAPPPFAAATFPYLAPLGTPATAPAVREPDDLADLLAVVSHRDQVSSLVLGFLTTLAPRVALFSLHQGKVMGWAARGDAVVDEDFHNLILPLDRPSLFLNLSKGVDLHVGPLGGGEGNDLLIEALGPPPPREAVVAPVRVRGKVASFLWLDCGEASVAELPLQAVREVARLTGLALEILVLRQKIKAGVRLTEGAGAE